MPRSNAIRGTLILLDANATADKPYLNSTLFNFQFNPENLTHTFVSVQGAGTVSNTTQGPTTELFNLTFDLESDDVDPQEQTQTTTDYGLHPVLAVIESMIQSQAATGNQSQLPTVVFKWGTNRVVTTQLISLNIDEKAFDTVLNPTKATVSLSMRVLQRSELKTTSAAYNICVSHLNLRNTLVGLYKKEHSQLEQSVGIGSVLGAATAGTQQGASAADSKQKLKA